MLAEGSWEWSRVDIPSLVPGWDASTACTTHLKLSLGDEKLIFSIAGDAAAPSQALEGTVVLPTQGAKNSGVSLVEQQPPPLLQSLCPSGGGNSPVGISPDFAGDGSRKDAAALPKAGLETQFKDFCSQFWEQHLHPCQRQLFQPSQWLFCLKK